MGTSPIISGVVDACTNTKKAPSISTWCLPAAHEATGLTRSMVFKKALLKILMKLCAMRSVTITDSWRHGMSPEGLTRALVPWIYIYIYPEDPKYTLKWRHYLHAFPIWPYLCAWILRDIYTIPEKCPKNTGIYCDIIEWTPVPIHFDSKFTPFFLLIFHINLSWSAPWWKIWTLTRRTSPRHSSRSSSPRCDTAPGPGAVSAAGPNRRSLRLPRPPRHRSPGSRFGAPLAV